MAALANGRIRGKKIENACESPSGFALPAELRSQSLSRGADSFSKQPQPRMHKIHTAFDQDLACASETVLVLTAAICVCHGFVRIGCLSWWHLCLSLFAICLCATPPVLAGNALSADNQPLVLHFEYAGFRQELVVSEESDVYLVTATERGEMEASGHLGRVTDDQVDLALRVRFAERDGHSEETNHRWRLRFGAFTSGLGVMPSGRVPMDISIRRGLDPVPTLLKMLRRRDIQSVTAARHLARLGEAASPAISELIQVSAFQDGHAPGMSACQVMWLRRAAVEALGAIGPAAKEAVPTLAKLVDEAPSGLLRVAAAVALWKIAKDAFALSALVAAIRDPDWDIRLGAINALRTLGVEASQAAPTLLSMLEEPDPSVRAAVADALWAIDRDPRAVDTLIAMLHPEGDGGREVEIIGRIGYPGAHRATEALAAEAFSSNSIHRWQVGKALVRVDPDGSRSVAAIAKILPQCSSHGVEQASDVLAHFGPTAVPRLRGLLDSEHESVRQLAFYTLWRIGAPAVSTLAEALSDCKADVRCKAAVWLRDVEADISPSVPYLIRALDDDVEEVRSEAASTLVEIGVAANAAVQAVLQSPNARTRELGDRILRHIEERARAANAQD